MKRCSLVCFSFVCLFYFCYFTSGQICQVTTCSMSEEGTENMDTDSPSPEEVKNEEDTEMSAKKPKIINEDVEMEDVGQDEEKKNTEELKSDVIDKVNDRSEVGAGDVLDEGPSGSTGEEMVDQTEQRDEEDRTKEEEVQGAAKNNEESAGGGSLVGGGSEGGGGAKREDGGSTPPGSETDDSEDDGNWRDVFVDKKFPTTLEGFKYQFKDGKLLHIETGEPFSFEVKKGDRGFNQRHYEALGDVITDEVYKLLEQEANMERVVVPKDATQSEAQSFFFQTKEALEKDKLLILIHGSGAVRAGQWARSLIINKDIESGTQIPYVKRGVQEGYGVLVLNTNENYAKVDGVTRSIRGNDTPQRHARYVWKNYVEPAKAVKRIDIVAHSFGGVVTVNLVKEFTEDFLERVQKIAFTDSVHSLSSSTLTRRNAKWLVKHAVNWVSSDDKLDTPQRSWSGDKDITRVSAGTPKHVETSWKSYESVFKFLTDQQDPITAAATTPTKKSRKKNENSKSLAATKKNSKTKGRVEAESSSKSESENQSCSTDSKDDKPTPTAEEDTTTGSSVDKESSTAATEKLNSSKPSEEDSGASGADDRTEEDNTCIGSSVDKESSTDATEDLNSSKPSEGESGASGPNRRIESGPESGTESLQDKETDSSLQTDN